MNLEKVVPEISILLLLLEFLYIIIDIISNKLFVNLIFNIKIINIILIYKLFLLIFKNNFHSFSLFLYIYISKNV